MKLLEKPLALLSIPYWVASYLLSGLDDEYYHIKMGDACMKLSLYWLAIKHFRKALKEKERAWCHMQLGWALYQVNLFEEALSHYRRAYERWPNPILAASLAKTELSQGNREQARLMVIAARSDEKSLNEESLRILSEVEPQLAETTAGGAAASHA